MPSFWRCGWWYICQPTDHEGFCGLTFDAISV
nr:MAG TPA: hypothetical protein [Herelleviridae sp.]